MDQGATAPAEAVEEEMTATAQEEEAPKLSVEEFCDAMETSAIFEHGEEAPFENAGKKRKKKGTKEKDSGDEGQVKRSLAQRYKIGIDILEMTVTYDMVHRLPAEAFDESDHTLGMLYGLFYFMKDGCLHNQEWFVEGAPPPPSDQWNPDGYEAWKILSFSEDSDIKHLVSKWEQRFEGYYLYL